MTADEPEKVEDLDKLEESAAGFVLAGGLSSRMGTDKALALYRGQPLVETALSTMRGAGLLTRIAGSRTDLSLFGEQVPDSFPDTGPLGGVHAGLRISRSDWAVFLPVDMPLMPSSLLATLLQRAQLTHAAVTVTSLNGRIEAFPVVLHRRALPLIEHRLQVGEAGCQSAWKVISGALGEPVDLVSVEHLVQCGHCAHPANLSALWWFHSANTRADLAWLNQLSQHFWPAFP